MSIKLNFNADGLPIFKSSQRCFWPILGNIHGKKYFLDKLNTFSFILLYQDMPHIQPMIIAIWCGSKKPSDLNEYLFPFVNELKNLLVSGIDINENHLSIAVRCFICDAPARAFMKGVTGKINILKMIKATLVLYLIKRHCKFQSHARMPKMSCGREEV